MLDSFKTLLSFISIAAAPAMAGVFIILDPNPVILLSIAGGIMLPGVVIFTRELHKKSKFTSYWNAVETFEEEKITSTQNHIDHVRKLPFIESKSVRYDKEKSVIKGNLCIQRTIKFRARGMVIKPIVWLVNRRLLPTSILLGMCRRFGIRVTNSR